jgi:signal transduction histidine kinase
MSSGDPKRHVQDVASVEDFRTAQRFASKDQASLDLIRKRHEALLQLTGGVVWSTDGQGCVTSPSAGWRKWTGQSDEAQLGWGWLDRVAPADRNYVGAVLGTLLKLGSPFEVPFRLMNAEDQPNAVVTRAMRLPDTMPAQWLCLTVPHDEGCDRPSSARSVTVPPARHGISAMECSEHEQLEGLHHFADQAAREADAALVLENSELRTLLERSENQLQEALERARFAEKRKDEFLAVLGHELRNPLAPIVTTLELMRLKNGAMQWRTECDVIERQVRHLIRLVDDLLDISRVVNGRIQLKHERSEIAPIVFKAVEMASPLLEAKAHNLTLSVPRDGLTVEADAARLAQAIANLLNNAAKFTEPGGSLDLTASKKNGEIKIRVRDDGIGIDPQLLPDLFDLFVQGSRSLDRSPGGLGIGLSMVKSLVRLHGGRVQAFSEGIGYGAEFVIVLPACRESSSRGDEHPRLQNCVTPSSGIKRVLVVDDNVDAARALADGLELFGYETALAYDGPEALATAREFKPDAALLDIGLPVMDGYELATRLRKVPNLCALRLVAITGYGQEADLSRSRAVGIGAHLVKPVMLDALHELLSGFERS